MASFAEENNQNNGAWDHFCGGAVVGDSMIITAAHCMKAANSNETIRQMTKIRLGDQNLNDDIHDDNVYEIQKIELHPSYMGWGPQYDLAIVYTKTKIRFNDRIKPICFPTSPYNEPDRYANEEVKFAGWGYYDTTHVASDDLRKATFKVLSKEECFSNALYARRKKYRDLWYCAGNEVSVLCFEKFHRYTKKIFSEWNQLVLCRRFWFTISQS